MRIRHTCVVLFGFCLGLSGQTVRTFDAASVKPPTKLGPLGLRSDQKDGPGTTDPGTFSCTNCSLTWLFNDAFGLPPYRMVGPDWLDEVRFDVVAKIPSGTTRDQFMEMLQNLLADRLQLKFHREKKEMPVCELSVAKNGPKFKEAVPKTPPKDDQPQGPPKKDADGYPILTPGMVMAISKDHARMQSENQTMEWFAGIISNQLGRPVVDATGLKARYDFMLTWMPAPMRAMAGSTEAAEPAGPGLEEAVQQQLGLKLDQKKGPVEVVVVDHVEKTASAN